MTNRQKTTRALPSNGGQPSGSEGCERDGACRSSSDEVLPGPNQGSTAGPTTTLVPLDSSFYHRANVVTVARALLGKVLVTDFGGRRTSGRIVEVEAYNGVGDRASHAWSGRRTRRTEVMYGSGGTAYVYLIYGLHHLFNVVTNARDVPHAVLVRALDPLEGIPVMLERVGKPRLDHTLTRGPGNLTRALGLLTVHTGMSLLGDGPIAVGDDGFRVPRSQIVATPRIGVDYAGEDAALPYRFFIKGNPYVSGPKSR
jgi:DNA-3-methyladenine glycosylase